ncbi:MAG: isoprenyl transferase [Acidobacteriota bacterium]
MAILDNFTGIIEPDSEDRRLLAELDLAALPHHIAVIMDGNGRWAKKRGRPRIFGHRAGADSVKSIVDTAARLELEAVTLYAFSTENWKRPKAEVSGLMSMLKRFLRSELDEVRRNNIRFQTIGDISALAPDVRSEIAFAVENTSANSGTILSVALNYGGRAEIVRACRRAAEAAIAGGRTSDSISEMDIEKNLYTADLPEVDLLIRTSGEMRLSNFLLWQLAYSEIFVTPTLWPDFRRTELLRAVIDYQKRDRRFGAVETKARTSS